MSEEPVREEPEELPEYKIEGARSSRSSCKTCKRKIQKDTLRLGVRIEGPFGVGFLWHHLTCAAKRHAQHVEGAYELRAWAEGVEVPPLEELRKLKEKAEEQKKKRKDPPYAERAPSGRSKCKLCGELIEKGALRVALPIVVEFYGQTRQGSILVHTACVQAALHTDDSAVEDPAGLPQELEANSRDLPPEDLARALDEIGAL